MDFWANQYIVWHELSAKAQNETVLVNTNRILWLLSVYVCSGKLMEIQILSEKVIQFNNNKKMYIPMQVEEIIKCFGDYGEKMPINTFKNNNCCGF